MATTQRTMDATPEQIWAVLADGWSYARWVVGTSAVREVDDGFPAPERALHYRVGRWPLRQEDRTISVTCEPLERLVLRAQAWPFGAAAITITLRARGSRTEVTLDEELSEGPVLLLHNPLTDALVHLRNIETLRRLEAVVRRRTPVVPQ